MSSTKNHVLHYRSNTQDSIPSPENLEYGEIAINYRVGGETLFIKNDNNEISKFPNFEQIISFVNSKLIFLNDVTVNTYNVISDTNDIFNFYSDIPFSGITSDDYAEIIFNAADAISGNFSPICETLDGYIRIFSKSSFAITIPTIIIHKN